MALNLAENREESGALILLKGVNNGPEKDEVLKKIIETTTIVRIQEEQVLEIVEGLGDGLYKADILCSVAMQIEDPDLTESLFNRSFGLAMTFSDKDIEISQRIANERYKFRLSL